MGYKLALLSAFIVSPAFADATLTCTLTGAGTANTSVPIVVLDADGARILAAALRAYPTTGTPPHPSTNKEAITAMLNDLLLSMLANVKTGDQATAARTASDAITPIVPK